MKKVCGAAVLTIATVTLVSAQNVSSVVHGTITKVDAAAKTIVVATGNGAQEVIHFADRTIVRGTVAGAKAAFHGLTEGSEVVAHCTVEGAKKTAVEVNALGKGGLKVVEGTISTVNAGARKVVVKTADGAEQAFDLTAHALAQVGRATAQGAEKAGRVAVHYTEEGGKKVVHFFTAL